MAATPFANVLKNNPYHDSKGRFTTADNATGKGFKGTLYHGSPATDIEEFDMSRAGSNTSSGEKLIYFTDSKQMAEDFSYERLEGSSKYYQERGKKGRVYEVEVEIKNPLDFRNLSEKDIDNILKLDYEGILTKEDVIDLSVNHQLLKTNLDLRAESLKKLGYDGLIANTGKAGHNSIEYAVVDSKQAKIVKSAGEHDPEKMQKTEVNPMNKSDDSFSIFKTDDDKRLVFGWASISITVDGEQLEDRQKDIIDPEDLEEAAYEYVLNFRDTGEEHISSMRKKGKLVESCVFTAEKQKAIGIPEGILPIGWWIGFKIEDDAAWERVKNGTYKMFSIEGKANRIPVEKGQLKGCGVLVVQDGKILSGTRIERGGRGKICGPGGHIEAGETPEEAAKREAMEEFGITCEELTSLGTLKDGSSAIFLCTKFSGTPETDEEEMTEPEWRTIEELSEMELFGPFEASLEKLSPEKRHSVAKTFSEVLKFNPYHDSLGRFATANGYATFTVQTRDPKKQHWADMAIARMKQQAAANPPAPPKPTKNFDSRGFADYDDADYHQLHSGRKYYAQQQLTATEQQAADNYLEPYSEIGSLYSHSQNMNYMMANGQTLKGKYKQTHDGMMSAMHNIGYNVELTRYDHDEMIDGLLKSLGVGKHYESMSQSALQKTLVGTTINENKFISTSYNNFKNASNASTFTSRAVKINYKVKANTQAMMPGVGSGGDFGEVVLAPTNGKANQGGKIVGVRFTGQMARMKGTQSFSQKQIEIDIEIG